MTWAIQKLCGAHNGSFHSVVRSTITTIVMLRPCVVGQPPRTLSGECMADEAKRRTALVQRSSLRQRCSQNRSHSVWALRGGLWANYNSRCRLHANIYSTPRALAVAPPVRASCRKTAHPESCALLNSYREKNRCLPPLHSNKAYLKVRQTARIDYAEPKAKQNNAPPAVAAKQSLVACQTAV